jgi:hypothetical protein
MTAQHKSGEGLEACPFCGPGESKVDLWHDDVARRWRVGCGRCGASTGTSPRDKTQAPAITAWNTRASGWQPIETAPRDGTFFVAVNANNARVPNPYFICYSDQPEAGDHFAEGAGWRCPGRDWPVYPTHWLPLPPTPKGEGA